MWLSKLDFLNVFDINVEKGLVKVVMVVLLSLVVLSNLMDFSSVFNLIGVIVDIFVCYCEKIVIIKIFNKVIL